MNITVEFSNGTSITDSFVSLDEFNLWIDNAIRDFGPVVYIKMNN